MVRKEFVRTYCRRGRLTAAVQNVFFHLLTFCEYSRIEVIYDDVTGEPKRADKLGRKSLARVVRPGNVTSSFTYDKLVELTKYDQKSVRNALHQLVTLDIVRCVAVPASSETKHKNAGGRPKALLRFEIGSEHAWNGPLVHGLAYPCLFPLQLVDQNGVREDLDGVRRRSMTMVDLFRLRWRDVNPTMAIREGPASEGEGARGYCKDYGEQSTMMYDAINIAIVQAFLVPPINAAVYRLSASITRRVGPMWRMVQTATSLHTILSCGCRAMQSTGYLPHKSNGQRMWRDVMWRSEIDPFAALGEPEYCADLLIRTRYSR